MKSLLMVIRGFLIGTAEAIPGISGGTVALITGIYRFLIESISDFFISLSSVVNKSIKPRRIEWSKLFFIAIGMVFGLLLMARIIEPLLTNYPGVTFSFFGGLVLASVYYPLRLAGKNPSLMYAWVLPGVFVGLLLSGELFEWQLQVVTPLAAAIAVSALVLPGVSGSFLLLLLGKYEQTISALNQLDFAYLLSFAGGALVGLLTIVFAVRWFLNHFPNITYLFMTGLMLGTLPALFPDLDPEVVDSDKGFGAIAGIFLVVSFIFIERRINSSSTDPSGQ